MDNKSHNPYQLNILVIGNNLVMGSTIKDSKLLSLINVVIIN